MTDIVITNTEGVTSTIQNLPAWATEATQKNMQTLLKGLGTSSQKIEAILRLQLKGYKETTKKTADGNKEIQKLLKVLDSNDKKEQKEDKAANKAMENAIKELNNLTEDSLTQLGRLGKNTNDQSDNLNKILKDLNNSGDGIMSFANLSGGVLGGFAKVVMGVTKLMGALGLAVLGALKYIGSSFVDTFKILNNSLSEGTGGIIGLTTNIENVARSANMAGMSLDEFATFAQANSKILRVLGAENFANLYSTTLLTTNGLLAMGMTADDSVESIMTELEYRRKFGLVLNQNSQQLQTSLLRSARELRIFANAVGMSEADLRNESQIREDNIDLMQSQVKAMGGNTMELVNSAQTISRALGAVGGENIINPIFEAISKGATGLSTDFITLGQNMPELITMIENEAARFDRGAGTLNADLGFDLIHLLRNTTQQQRNQLDTMARAGIEGAADLQNMMKKAQALSEEVIVNMRKDLNSKDLSVLNVFNRLGFVINQVTATLGDLGKTFALEFLGFGAAVDENGKTTFDFNKGVASITKNMKKFATNVFGYNSPITDAFDSLATYIDDLFQPQKANESDADYQTRLDDARTKFVSTISKFAIDLARDLQKQIKDGTLFGSIKNFFINFFDELRLAINDATGGVLFDDAADRIAFERFRKGEMTNQEYIDAVGSGSGNDRRAIREAMFERGVESQARALGISQSLSGVVNSGKAKFGKDGRHTEVVMDDLRDNVAGFDNLSTTKQKELFDARVKEVAEFNANVMQYVNDMKQLMDDAGLDYDSYFYIGDEMNFADMLERLRLSTDVNEKNLPKIKNLMRQNTDFTDYYSQDPMYLDRSAYAKMSLEAINKQLVGVSASGRGGAAIPGLFDQLATSTFDNANTENGPMSIGNTAQYKALDELYKRAMEDSRMDYRESEELSTAISELNKYIKDENTDNKDLILRIEKLIEAQDNLTNEIKADNAS